MRQRSVTATAALSVLFGLALVLPAQAFSLPPFGTGAPLAMPVADMEDEAVKEDLRPDEVPEGSDAMSPKGTAEEERGEKRKDTGDLENEEIQKDMAPDTEPSGQ